MERERRGDGRSVRSSPHIAERTNGTPGVLPRDELAEGEGFEPPGPRGPPVFKTGAINQALPPLQVRDGGTDTYFHTGSPRQFRGRLESTVGSSPYVLPVVIHSGCSSR